MKRDFLTELGLEKEQTDKIMAEHGRTLNKLQEEKEVAEHKAAEVDELKQQIADRDKQLEDLSEKAKNNKELTAEIDQLKQANETAKQEYEQKLKDQSFEHALDKAISGAKAKNARAVKALLNTDDIKLDGEKLLGLDDQLEALKESDSYLFGEEEPAGLKGRQPHITNEPPKGVSREELNKMSYKERVQFKQDNPEQYEKLIKGE